VLRSNKTKLRVLNANACGIGRPGLEELAHALETKFTRLEELSLEANFVTASDVSALSSAVRDNPFCCLQVLNLTLNSLKKDSAEFLCHMFGKLRELDLVANDFGLEGMVRIALGLTEWGSALRLEKLSLGGSTVGTKAAAALAQAMGGCGRSLCHVDLSSCSIGDEGAALFATHVIGNRACAIRVFDLSSNEILPAGMRAIVNVLKDTELETLEVGEQWVGDEIPDDEDGTIQAELDGLLEQVEEDFDRFKSHRRMYVLVSPRLVRRIGANAALRKLPPSLVAMVAELFFD
jgi:hypothetical protein